MRVLGFYLAAKFMLWVAITGMVFIAIAFLGDFLEMLKLATRHNQGTNAALYYSWLRLPLMVVNFLPFIFLFGGVFCLLRLSESRELVVIRAAGISAWQYLTPLLLTALFLGIAIIAALDPLGSRGLQKFRAIEDGLNGSQAQFSVSKSGIWFRDRHDAGSMIIRAPQMLEGEETGLAAPSFMVFDENGRLAYRLQAQDARLSNGNTGAAWHLTGATKLHYGRAPENIAHVTLASRMQIETLRSNFRRPETVSLWQLPNYIEMAAAAGVDITAHSVRFHGLISKPLLLVSMVLLAACFSMPTSRMVPTFQTLGLATLSGFGLFLANAFIVKVAQTGLMHPIFASWAPPLIASSLALMILLQNEDG